MSGDYGGVLCFLALALASPLSASPLRGVSPRGHRFCPRIASCFVILLSFRRIVLADEKYFMGPVIACRDGAATFPRDRLNDGFCDCPDGTDEPGTSACPESKFYCRNMGDAPRFLFSSRVNDHICDCCDGSDEYESGAQCPNTCHKDTNPSENSTVAVNPESNDLDDLDTQSRNTRIDLENLIKNIGGLRAVTAMQMIVCAIVMVAFCCHHYRYNRIRRRKYILSR
ncbi:hypothetical protein ZIOFF_007635 [Zingiber officinale]|uniref:Glucosidase II beta subunit N-terminal domain-containing protein n=1 Tax=Zingiber officinale TaxID=94328 RepID=A0A8J5IE44_ZINOF|nr:hypothetical protein ZIOFF_007635 [Zingiber officinale]